MTFEDDLLALERRVLEGAGGDFFRAVADLRRMLAADTGGAARRLEELALPALEEAASQGTLDGWTLGGQRAVTAAETALRVDPNTLGDADLRLLTPPTHLTDPFTGLDTLLADAKRRSVALLRSGADEATAAAPVFQAATTARSRIVTQVNAASNLAALEVGDATRSPMVWEAERDACVYCLALAGEVVEQAGDLFPPADLYAPTPSSMTTTSTPPLHPHCRCRLAILVSREYADALKREAQRSILRGHSLASESQAVRVRAAARLLERDPVAPKSVKAFAAAAVKRGHFPTRDVPEGDPRLVITRPGESGPLDKPTRPPGSGPNGRFEVGREVDVRRGARPAYDRANPLAFYGNVVTLEGESPTVRGHAAVLESFPRGAHELLRDYMAEKPEGGFYLGDRAVPELDHNGELRGVRPRGWSEGSTWDQVAGAYSPTKRACSCGGDTGGHGSTSLVGHEGGHALDDALTTRRMGQASSSYQWRDALDTIDASSGAMLSPYFSKRGNPTGYHQEAWAEAWAIHIANPGATEAELTKKMAEGLAGVRPFTKEEAKDIVDREREWGIDEAETKKTVAAIRRDRRKDVEKFAPLARHVRTLDGALEQAFGQGMRPTS